MNISEDVARLNPGLVDALKGTKPAKYGNAEAQANGMRFQSGREAAGVANLILLEKHQEIFALRLQVKFPISAQISYIADAVFLDKELKPHVIDFKGVRTKDYRIKAKLFAEKYGQAIEEW